MPVLTHHAERVQKVALSPTGRLLASGGYDRHIIVWDARRGLPLARLEVPGAVYALDFSQNGHFLLAAGEDGVVRGYSMTAAYPLSFVYEGHLAPIWTLATSPDGHLVASGDERGQVLIWDMLTRETLVVNSRHMQQIEALAWSPDGTCVASASRDHWLRVWQALTQHEVFVRQDAFCWINGLAWAPDSTRYLACAVASQVLGELDHALEVWDVLDHLLEMSYPIPGYGQAVAWLDSATKLVVALLEGSLVFVSFSAEGCHAILERIEDQRPLTDMVMSRSGKLLVTAHHDGSVLVRQNTLLDTGRLPSVRPPLAALVAPGVRTGGSAAVAKQRLLAQKGSRP
jgi:WD40 repeat protein